MLGFHGLLDFKKNENWYYYAGIFFSGRQLKRDVFWYSTNYSLLTVTNSDLEAIEWLLDISRYDCRLGKSSKVLNQILMRVSDWTAIYYILWRLK